MLTRHHRKPRSRGGRENHENISIVDDKKHQAYHTMFGNMTTKELVNELNKKYLHGFVDVSEKKMQAFILLFGNMRVSEIVRYLNETWIDPDDKIYVTRRPFIQLYEGDNINF